ncbi:CwfJ C-terminus 1-domain-containing protein-like protein [Spinellus fusiger]|nr:CwfJ C-terminus 1-domain-containing protein-like protein [Spinellus fusiger]
MGEHKESKKSSREGKIRHHKKHKKSSKSSKRSERQSDGSETEIDYDDPSLWVESTEVSCVSTTQVTTEAVDKKGEEARHEWMLSDSFDFSSLGEARIKKEDIKPHPEEPKVSARELNVHLKNGLHVDQYPKQEKKAIQFGDAGSSWRMKKLKRIMEQAEEEGRSVQEVALERYGSREKMKEAFDEREYLDRNNKRSRHDTSRSSGKNDRRYTFTGGDKSGQAFYRPRTSEGHDRLDEFGRETKRRRPSRSRSRSRSPIRAVEKKNETEALQQLLKASHAAQPHTPVIITQHDMSTAFSENPILTRDELNKMNAKVMKARLMGSENADQLEKDYQVEVKRTEAMQAAVNGQTTGNASIVTVLPTVDSDGRLYDTALSHPGTSNRERSKKERFAGTHDPKTGERIKYSTSENAMSLMEMVRQEKAGSKRATNMDLEFANRIVSDVTFENTLDYMDERADVMATKKGMSEEQKMRYAVNDYKRTQQVLERCRFCYHDANPPQCAMIALGTQTYLALPNVQELVPGHCMIVPLQHVTSTLEFDDTVWTEIRNFQKCLLQMFHEQNCGVIFMETVTNLRSHRHTAIEAIPVPYGIYEDMPAFFKEAILMVDEEWSQHKKLIDTTERGFRNSMVKNLPYFHVWCGLGTSYGHVIENEKEFPYWFGKEIIAGALDIGPERWRRPKYQHKSDNQARQKEFLKSWEKWDWTSSLDQ